jgi:hypothetical protein
LSIRVGDTVFIRNGTPAVVKNRDEQTGVLTLDSDQKEVQTQTRNGITNGLSEENRAKLQEIMDAAKGETADPAERVERLKNALAEIENDPTQHTLARYLRGEMHFIMNSFGIKPREFSLHESKAR